MKRSLLLLALVALLAAALRPGGAVAQDDERQQRLRTMAAEADRAWRAQRARVRSYAEAAGIPLRTEFEDGGVAALQRIENGHPVFYTTYNRGGAITSSVDAVRPGGNLGLALTGESRRLGIWDGGRVRATHQEFGGRVQQQDNPSSVSGHATHVGGTMVAAGVRGEAKGMAYKARLDAYSFGNDNAEMAAAAAAGLRVSNHSYGRITGWYRGFCGGRSDWTWFGDPDISPTEDYRFGFYGDDAKTWDEYVRTSRRYVIVQSAGNDRDDRPPSQPTEHFIFDENGNCTTSQQERAPDGGANGYESLGNAATAKNILTVGAVEGIEGGYSAPSDVQMSSFSSWGPTDDGRLKPDLVAKGVSVLSSYSGGDADYVRFSGTSMSSPMVSGSVALLQEHYRSIHGRDPWASTVKSVLIHTADEAGNTGPDYKFGWGLMNVERAAKLMSRDGDLGGGAYVQERTLSEGETIEYRVPSDGTEPLRTSIAWTDPAGTVPSRQLDPSDRMLVNDLNVHVEGPDGTVHRPYVMDPANPDRPASTGDNERDNVEQVLVENTQQGEYIVRVSHDGALEGGAQDLSVVLTGAVPPPKGLAATPAGSGEISLTWDEPEANPDGYDLYRSPSPFDDVSNATKVNGGSPIDGAKTSYVDPGVTDGSAYYYRLVAVAGNSESVPSNEAAAFPPPLSAPSGVSVSSVGSDDATIVWDGPAANRLSGYHLYRSTSSFTDTTSATRVTDARLDASTNAYTDQGLQGGATYHYRVVPVDDFGDSGRLSDETSETLLPPPPSGVTATTQAVDDATEAVRLEWSAPEGSAPSGYRVYRSRSPSVAPASATEVTERPIGTPAYTDAGGTMGTTYHYRVTAQAADGRESEPSGTVAATPSNPIPGRPGGVTATETEAGTGIKVSWTPIGATDVQRYRVYRDTKPLAADEASELAPHDSSTAEETSFVDAEAEEGTTYYYRITAVDRAGGESALSTRALHFLYPKTVTADIARSFDEADESADYRLVALPGGTSKPLSEAIEGEPGVDWQAYRDEGDGFKKYDPSDPFSFEAGAGLWLTSTDDWSYNETVSTIKLRGDTASAVPLRKGWNVIANPLGTDVSWADVQSMNDGVSTPLWGFDRTFERRDVFRSARTGEAFYVFNETDRDTLLIPHPDAPTSIATTARKEERQSPGTMIVRATSPRTPVLSSSVRLGLAKSEGRERTVVAPPGRFEPISLRIQAQEAQRTGRASSLMAAYRTRAGEGRTFALRLRARNGEGAIRITADSLDQVDAEAVSLLHPARDRSYDLQRDPDVSIRPRTEDGTMLRVSIGTQQYVEASEKEVRPDEVSMTVYPNPVNRRGTIDYTLPEKQRVELRVYDLLGREVATLASGTRDAGRHRLSLPMEQLSSGVYFGRLQTEGGTRTQKITVVR
ncbi:S8 family serine peptidase [Salinibacter ruber]|uniref:S8 family serine peptidase n=1 Tax=Salinibacter ruber TaxID=146919 RepID=UPI0013C32463|nr:S8 family serine peptidase [Salinibacter ruber]